MIGADSGSRQSPARERKKSPVWLASQDLLAFNQRGSVLSGVLRRKSSVAFTSPQCHWQGQFVAVLNFVPHGPLLKCCDLKHGLDH